MNRSHEHWILWRQHLIAGKIVLILISFTKNNADFIYQNNPTYISLFAATTITSKQWGQKNKK
jgi:hypothetical protein